MTKRKRKLQMNVETLRVLSPSELAGLGSGVPTYDTSIDHNGCSGPTVKLTCFSHCYSNCGDPCYES
jgi:hypothetical protein